jgi:dipeptidyl aminopeptidase/acylaminoacyl peptidase
MRNERRSRSLFSGLAFLLAVLAVPAAQAVPLEVYGRLPALEEVSLSPDGSRIAFVRTSGNTRLIEVVSLADRKFLGGLRVGDQKLRRVEWADANRLMIVTSETSLPWGLRGMDSEWFLLQIYDLAKRETRPVPSLGRSRDTNLMNVISGRVMVRTVKGHTVLFVPGVYLQEFTLPALIRIDLDTGRQRVIREAGLPATRWLVDSDGEVVAEHQYDEERQQWTLKARRGGELIEVASGKAAIDYPELVGLGPSGDTLLMQIIEDGVPVWRLLSPKDGTFGPPLAEARGMQEPIEERQTHRMIGGTHIDDDERYFFFDPKIQAHWNAILRAFGGVHVGLVSASADFKKIVVLVDGPSFGYQYELVDIDQGTAVPVGDVYEGLTSPLEVRRITYPAADGLKIPAYITLPPGRPAMKLPLVVLPHGGPAVRDTAKFDWWSQALADQGYLVLRPNYRGSAVSQQFLAAGFGEFGRKMQTDLSDGVRHLTREGIADPARVCIVGASYGGYAALAGVTLDPGVYRCAVSVAGISDLKEMLKWVNEKHLSNENLAQRYWDRFLGVAGLNDPALDSISPIKHLDSLKVPVLLVHGKDDTVVAFDQSEDMYDAMRRAGKRVEFITLKGEDHWLSRGETRLQMLQATVAFLRTHNPPDLPAAK